ncbi:MAG TPA: DEAD/DEAH box helicase [Hanamia sp.]|nr:DEAD/DEAH box helicase [Hanamia sp.]
MLFKELHLIAPILKALEEEGYTEPTPIQQQSIPHILRGKDLMGCAQTGTGKTAAFAIPILQNLVLQQKENAGNHNIKVLILTPTRELAIQIDESFASYGKYTGIKHTVIFGGVSQFHQTKELKRNPDVLIATPGRLLDLISQKLMDLKKLGMFVLDEADRMLDMGFIHDVSKVISYLPEKRQSLFFSATMPNEIVRLSASILKNPVKVEVTPVSSTAENVAQQIYLVEKNDKRELLIHLLKNEEIQNALVFTRTKYGADKIARALHRANIKSDAIHGNKTQQARQKALNNFKEGKIRVLVATDIAARGIDVDELSHVINFELPNIPETYVHRIGRTGRAGNSGIALSFCDMEERAYLRDIHKLIDQTIPVVQDHPYASKLNFVQSPVSTNILMNRRPASHNGFRRTRSWSQGR